MSDEEKHAGGRPLLFETVEELEDAINEYFDKCDEEKRPYTMSGLANALNTNRTTLLNYERKEKYFNTIKSAKSRLEQYAEENLYRSTQVAGVIFNLKNNYKDWKDKQEIDNSHKFKDLPTKIVIENAGKGEE